MFVVILTEFICIRTPSYLSERQHNNIFLPCNTNNVVLISCVMEEYLGIQHAHTLFLCALESVLVVERAA